MQHTLKAYNREEKIDNLFRDFLKTASIQTGLVTLTALILLSPAMIWIKPVIYLMVSLMVGFAVSTILIIPVYNSLKTTDETITILNDGFKITFLDRTKYPKEKLQEVRERDEVEFKFDEITRIEINRSNGIIYIFGPMNTRLYKDYERNSIKKTKKIDDEKNYWMILPIFKEDEQFARFISNKTHLMINYHLINFPLRYNRKLK